MGQILDVLCLKESKNDIQINYNRNDNQRNNNKRQPFKRIHQQNNTNKIQNDNFQNQKIIARENSSSISNSNIQQTSNQNSSQVFTKQDTESDFLIKADSVYFAGHDLITSFLKNKFENNNKKKVFQDQNTIQEDYNNQQIDKANSKINSMLIQSSFLQYVEIQEQKKSMLKNSENKQQDYQIIQSYLDSFIQKVVQEAKENISQDIDESVIKISLKQALSQDQLELEENHYSQLRDFLLANQINNLDINQSQAFVNSFKELKQKYSLTKSLFEKIQRDSSQINIQFILIEKIKKNNIKNIHI